MRASVPRHLNKRPLIAGLEPIELLGVAALLIGSNIVSKAFELSGLWAAATAIAMFGFLKIYKRGKPRGHFLHLIKYTAQPSSTSGFPRSKS
jgi:hypothetical protein